MSSIIIKSAEADLREKSSLWLDLSFVFSLFVTVAIFYGSSSDLTDRKAVENVDKPDQLVVIPPTQQIQTPPPPARPSIPVEAEDDEEIDEVTIEDTEVDLREIVSQIDAPEEEDEIIPFYEVSQKPEITKRVNPKYPDIAIRAGVEATVTIQLTVSETGLPTDIKVIKGHPMLNQAAVDAVKLYRFKPGMQRDKPVKVKWAIPIRFRLKN
jgi:periplasmic protein TonB